MANTKHFLCIVCKCIGIDTKEISDLQNEKEKTELTDFTGFRQFVQVLG